MFRNTRNESYSIVIFKRVFQTDDAPMQHCKKKELNFTEKEINATCAVHDERDEMLSDRSYGNKIAIKAKVNVATRLLR